MLFKSISANQAPLKLRTRNLVVKSQPIVGFAACCWVALLSIGVLPESAWANTVTLASVGGGLLLSLSTWMRKSSAGWGIALFGLAAISYTVLNTSFDPASGTTRFSSVILLLLGIGILRKYLVSQNISHVIEQVLGQPRLRESPFPLFLLYSSLTFLLSLAVVPLVGVLTRNTQLNHREHVRIAMRSVGSTMFIAPTTVGAAAVALMFPDLNWGQAAVVGMPLATAMLVLTCLRGAGVGGEKQLPSSGPADLRWLYRLIGLFISILISAKFVVGLTTVTAVALAVSLSGALSTIHAQGLRALIANAGDAVNNSSAEILMFIACGTLFVALNSPEGSLFLQSAVEGASGVLSITPVQALVIVSALPLLSVCGVHPMVLFTAFFPIFHSVSTVGNVIQYHWWIAMFVIAQLISPVSISAIAAASSIGLSPSKVSLRLHAGFALLLSICCVGYLSFVGYFL
tara:strand:+ start:2510 stop:3886 length:1377 start_codon:yes stop_codon:yes gene_type:complete